MLVTKRKAVCICIGLIVLLCPIPLSATTVLVFVTSHGIVMSTDSKMSTLYTLSDYSARIGEGTTKKFVLVQDRILVGSIGHADIRRGPVHYNFLTWMEELETGLPKDISVDDLTSTIQRESAKVFVGFDAVLKADVLKRKDATDTCTSFIEYIIAGYQNGTPRVYVVQFYIDWNEKRLSGPWRILRDSGQRMNGNFRAYAFGIKEALTDMLDRQSYAYKQAMIMSPRTFGNLLGHKDVSLDETVSLARVLVRIEENTNPNDVGGAIQVAKVLPSGRAYNLVDELPKAKGNTKRKKHPRQHDF
jgi:hypothetical protein